MLIKNKSLIRNVNKLARKLKIFMYNWINVVLYISDRIPNIKTLAWTFACVWILTSNISKISSNFFYPFLTPIWAQIFMRSVFNKPKLVPMKMKLNSQRKIEALPAPSKIKTSEEVTPVCITIFKLNLALVA